jgi:hypothetical protein
VSTHQNAGASTALPPPETPPETDTPAARYQALFASIDQKIGFTIVECEIAQNLCALRDETRLEQAIGYLRDNVIAIAKSYRELQALSAAPPRTAVSS